MKKIFFTCGIIFLALSGQRCFAGNQPPLKGEVKTLEGITIVQKLPHLSVYGHGLLDGIIPLYTFLKKNNLLDQKFNVVFVSFGRDNKNACQKNLIQFTKEIFHAQEVIAINNEDVVSINKKNLVTKGCTYTSSSFQTSPFKWFENAYPESSNYADLRKGAGFDGNFLFYDPHNKNNIVREFVKYVLDFYGINQRTHPLRENSVLISKRIKGPRLIYNLDELERAFQNQGFDVEVVDFSTLSVKEQIQAVYQTKLFVGAAGSNMTNAIFMRPSSKTLFIYPKHSRIEFRSGDVISHAILAAGVHLLEYEKPFYDEWDLYYDKNKEPKSNILDYSGNIIRLKPKFLHFSSGDTLTLYSIYNVDFYIDAEDVVKSLTEHKAYNVSFKH